MIRRRERDAVQLLTGRIGVRREAIAEYLATHEYGGSFGGGPRD